MKNSRKAALAIATILVETFFVSFVASLISNKPITLSNIIATAIGLTTGSILYNLIQKTVNHKEKIL